MYINISYFVVFGGKSLREFSSQKSVNFEPL